MPCDFMLALQELDEEQHAERDRDADMEVEDGDKEVFQHFI